MKTWGAPSADPDELGPRIPTRAAVRLLFDNCSFRACGGLERVSAPVSPRLARFGPDSYCGGGGGGPRPFPYTALEALLTGTSRHRPGSAGRKTIAGPIILTSPTHPREVPTKSGPRGPPSHATRPLPLKAQQPRRAPSAACYTWPRRREVP